MGLGKISSRISPCESSETVKNSELRPYLSSRTWKNSERSLEARLERHETRSLFFGLANEFNKVKTQIDSAPHTEQYVSVFFQTIMVEFL